MNTLAKLKFGLSPYEAPEPPMHLSPEPTRTRAKNKGVRIVNNSARNLMMRRAGLQFIDPSKVRTRGRQQRDDINLFAADVSYEEAGEIELTEDMLVEEEIMLPEPEIISLDTERIRRAPAPVRRSIFNTRTAVAAAAGALLGVMASGAGLAYGMSQMETPSKAASAQMVKAPAAPAFDESARVLAEMGEAAQAEVELTRTMDCSVPFETLGKKMNTWGGWETALGGISKKSKEGSVCDAHQAIERRWGTKVADKFEYEAVNVPESSKTVEVKKEKKSGWGFAKSMVNKAKGLFGRWA